MDILRTFLGTPKRALWTLFGLFAAFAAIFPSAALALAGNVGLVLYYVLDRVIGVTLGAIMPSVPFLVGIGFCAVFIALMWRKVFSPPKPAKKKGK